MEVEIRTLVDSEHALRKANNDIRKICDDVNSVSCVVGSMKSLDVPNRRLKLTIDNLERLRMSLSQMACFLEMANETYVRTERQITDRHSINVSNQFTRGWVIREPKIIQFRKMSSPGSDWDLRQIFKSIESD